MNLNEIPAWSDIESQPWFAELTPEEKQQSLTKWQGDMMSFAKDPKEKFAVAATSKAKARSFFGEEMPDDPIADALQRRQKDLEDIGSRYDAFSKGELEEDDEEVLTLNDTLKGNTPYSVIKGRLFVSPQLVWDKAAYEKVVNEAPVDEDERVLAMSAYDGSKERAAEGVVNSLGYTDEAFRDFAAKGFKEGKSNAAILDEWKANNKLPDGILGTLRGVGRQAYFGLRSGLSGLERAMGGLGGFFGSESAQKYAEESGKEAQSYMQRTLGEGPEFIGELTSGAVSIIPTMAAGAAASLFTEGAALPAAASITAGAIQSAGATQAETYEFYRNQGLDHANALAESRVDGLVSGLITGAITHYAGKLGDKIGLGKGIEGLFGGPASKIASKLTQREISESLKAGAKAVGGSFLQEGSEELLDQAAQDAYSMIKRDPTLTLAEAINNALQAGKVGAVLGGAAEAGKIGLKSLLNSAKFSVAETPLEKELQSFFEGKQIAADAVVGNPNVQNYIKALGTAQAVVDENAPINPRTGAVLEDEVKDSAKNLTNNIKEDVTKVFDTVIDNQPPVDSADPIRDSGAVIYDLRSAETGEAMDLDSIEMALDNAERKLQKGQSIDWAVDRTWLPNVSTASVPALKQLLGSQAGIEAMRERIAQLREEEAPVVSPKETVSPASENALASEAPPPAVTTAPLAPITTEETQPPQGKPVETPTNALPLPSTTSRLPSEERPEMGLQHVGEGNAQPEKVAETGQASEEVKRKMRQPYASIAVPDLEKVSTQDWMGRRDYLEGKLRNNQQERTELLKTPKQNWESREYNESAKINEVAASLRAAIQDMQLARPDLERVFAERKGRQDEESIPTGYVGGAGTELQQQLETLPSISGQPKITEIAGRSRGDDLLARDTSSNVVETNVQKFAANIRAQFKADELVEKAEKLKEKYYSINASAGKKESEAKDKAFQQWRKTEARAKQASADAFAELRKQNKGFTIAQLEDREPFMVAKTLDQHGLTRLATDLGYVKQGDLYVFQTPSPPTTGAVPTKTRSEKEVAPQRILTAQEEFLASKGVTDTDKLPQRRRQALEKEYQKWLKERGGAFRITLPEQRGGGNLILSDWKQAYPLLPEDLQIDLLRVVVNNRGRTATEQDVTDAMAFAEELVSQRPADERVFNESNLFYDISRNRNATPEIKARAQRRYEEAQGLPSPPTTGAVPTKTLPAGQKVTPGGVASPGVSPETAPEPAPKAQPEQPVSQPVQAFRDAVSQMTPTAQAKWTPELRATAEAYLDSGGTTGLQGLSDVQQKVVGRFLPEDVKAAFDAEDARKRAQRNKLPDHRESSLPPTPGKQIRKIGKGAMESVPVVLDEIAKVIPNIRDLVEVRESVEGEPDAEGFYDPQADKAVVLVDNVYLKPQHGGSQEAALRETIIHELLHRGFAKLRQTNPQLFEQFEAFSLADTNDAQFEALVRRGYTMYSNWKDDPTQNQKAREEIFIRKAVVDLNFKGIEAIKSPSSLASQFFSWLRGLLNKLLGRKVDDETLLHWSRVFLNAAQADFIEKTPGERMHAFTAYHGTPHKVDKFSLSKIGTGEGAQAYGWGLYFAQNKGVAKSYQEVLSGGNRLLINGKTLEDATVNLTPTQIKWAQEVDHYVGEMQEPLERAKGYVREGIEDALERKSFERFASTFSVSDSSGNLYTVEIMPDEDEFLDWDKPLSEQSEKVKNILSPIVEELIQRQIKRLEATPSIAAFGLSKKKLRSYAEEFLAPNLASGMGLYDLVRGLEGNKRGGVTPDDMSRIASEYLASIGIPGIRYLDADSRGKEDGTRNYVIFDENLVKILEENGQVLTPPAESDIRYSLADKDAEYLDAVEAGDMEKAQKMVDEAAYSAGNTRIAYHGTHRDFNVFDRLNQAHNFVGIKLDTIGSWFTDGPAVAKSLYGPKVKRTYLRLQKPLVYDGVGGWLQMFKDAAEYIYKADYSSVETVKEMAQIIRDNKPSKRSIEDYRNHLIQQGYDGIELSGDIVDGELQTISIVFNPNQIKSADPVTRDDAGNVIPLSQRFQTVSPDIRYSLGEPPDMQAEADALREVTPNSQALDKFRETFGTPRQDVGQVLGKKEGSGYTQAQVAPLIEYARSMIGFENDADGEPIISPEATQKALNMVANLNGRPGFASQFNVRAAEVFKGKPVDPEIATAVLTQELQVYANRLSASSPKAEDQILKAALTPFYNTQILGSYLSRRIAGRTLQAASMASGETGDARKSREEAEKAVNKEITKQLGDEALPAAEGMDKAGVEGGVDAIKDDIPAPADPTLRLLDLAVESLDEVAKADAEAVFEMLLDIAQLEELVAQDEKVGSKAMSILRSPNLAARNYPTDPAERKALLAQKKAEVAEKLAKLRSSLEGAKPETKKKVKERATKAGGKAKTAPKVSDKEEDPITKEINALAAELGTLSKLDQAGLDVVKQIAKKLVAKFQPAKLDALKDKVEAVVYKYVQNAERLELAEFSEKMTADLDAIGLKKPELQEALVAKAWAYHFAAPTKAVQALTAKMKSAERADRGGPESVANVRKAINGAVNSTEENRDAFVARLTDQLVALGVEPQSAEAAAKAAFEYRAKQADKKIERVMETLRLGKRRALLKSFQSTKEADRTEEWQRATLKAAFVEAGLTNKQAEKGADKAMQEAEAIFATAEMKVAEIKQRGVQKFLDSLASVEDETPVTKTKQDNLRSVFKDATLDEEFNEAVLMDRFQTLGATEAQAKALVEKVAEVREDKAEALAEAKRKQVNKVIDATYKRIAQLESGTPSEKAKKQESLRNAVGAAIKAKEFDEAAFRASVASFGASEPQVETLVQNVKKLRQLGESKPLSKAKLRQFLLSFPKNVLANPEQREALLRSFLDGKDYSEAEINRIVPQVLRDFDTGYQKARKAYLDELEKKLKPKQGQKESKQDQQNRKMLNALRSGLADTTSETSVALAKSLGFEAFRPQDDHILSKLDEEMRKLREQGRLSDSNAKFDAIKSLLIRRRPPRGFGEVVAQSWITSALSSLSNLAVNVWAPMGEAGVRLMSDIVRATALRKFDEIPLYFEAAGKAMKGTLSRFNFAVKTDTFTNSVNTLIAGMASMKDEMQRSAAVLKDKNASPAAKVNARLRYVMSFGDYSRRILSSIDDTWYTALSSYVGSSNLIKLLGDAKMPKKAVEAIVFHANNDALNQARAEYETLQAVEQFIEAMRGKTNEEIDAGFEYLGLNDASVTKEQANYIQELVSAFQSLRLRSGAAGDELIKRALKELRNFRASVSVRATELGQMRTKELVREALSDTQTPAQVEEAIKEFDENAKKAASFGMGLHRVEGVPPYDILGNMFGIVDAMGRQAVQKSPLLGRMIVGFFGIPLNLLNRAVWFTPYGLGRYFLAKWQMAKNPEEKFYEYSMASQRERTMRFTEAAVGTSMTMLLYALGVARDSDDKEDEGFYITLGGPSNKTEYDAWYARGFRKFSICYKTKSGSVVSVPYGRGTGEVLKGPLMLLGAFDDMRLNKKLGDREDMSSVIEYLNAAAAGIGKQATFLGAKNTAGAFFSEQFGTSTASNLAYSAANLIPFNGLDRSISALALGPPDRSRTGAIWANIPIVRHLAHQPAINVFGDPWGNKSESALNQLWDRQWNLGLIPLNISAPLTGNQKRLYNFIGERLMGPSDPLRGALELRNGYLTDEEFYRYKQYRGKQMAQTWLTDLDRWRKLDDDSLSKAIAELSTKATKKAKDRFNYK